MLKRPLLPTGPNGPLFHLPANSRLDHPSSLPPALRESVENYDASVDPFLADCDLVGWNLNGPWDLLRSKPTDPLLFPILVKHLQRDYPKPEREGMLYALSDKGARPLALDLIKRILHAEIDDSSTRIPTAACNVLTDIATKDDIPYFKSVLLDEHYGDYRAFFVALYARLAKREAIPLLRELLRQKQFLDLTINELGKLRDEESLTSIKHYLVDPKASVRKAARTAVQRLQEK